MNGKFQRHWDVITAGDVFTDLVMSGFPRWPQPGEESFATMLHREAGGGAAITACGLAKLGVRVALLAVIGRDGDWLVERLKACGVDDELIHRPDGDCAGLTVSVSTAEDRAFFTYAGSNQALPELLAADAAARNELNRARHVHLSFRVASELLAEIAATLHDAGCTVSLDVGWHPDWLSSARTLHALRGVDLFLPNEREAELMTGQSEPEKMLRAFADAGLRAVALKLGANGSALLSNGEIIFCPPVSVEPVDTTGAGDCFDAGFIYGWLNDRMPDECLRLGNICGALSTRGFGGIAPFPTREELNL
ncbi:MAG TPA: carbohydrate kinase family protein [Blastocatellia bacterium]|nr:carbohydrate kinase family protein [Blastocatellia bacterium]